MRMKQKYIAWAVCAALILAALYTGISCAATISRAVTQPHLMAGDVRYDFLGYYMMAAAVGGISLACIAAAAVIFICLIRKKGH